MHRVVYPTPQLPGLPLTQRPLAIATQPPGPAARALLDTGVYGRHPVSSTGVQEQRLARVEIIEPTTEVVAYCKRLNEQPTGR